MLLAVIAAGCSGAHQAVTPTPALPQPAQHAAVNPFNAVVSTDTDDASLIPSTAVTAEVEVTVPSSASSAMSASVSANGGTAVVANLSSSSPGCTGSSPVVCTIPVSTKTGAVVFALKTFSGTGGTGSTLASGDIDQTLTTSSFTVHVILAATPA
ncbi:MAG TPA: hypothetical protein VEJ20_02170, partial [Candidatus Eremiobacteraceae bacterium]|nr:hypothetical protein [Candidatus Eremiobacteraceae bacterium]